MIKAALITASIITVTVWGFDSIETMLDGYRAETTYYHCVRSSAAITDIETVKVDQDCRQATGYKGE